MLQTYKAILRGNYLEWSGDAPGEIEGAEAVEVQVTILSTATAATGEKMAAALEKLAAVDAFAEIADPPTWQQEQRRERSLPDRDA